jgi:hypothetical protein
MLDAGTKRLPKLEAATQTDLSLVPITPLQLASDHDLADFAKRSNLGILLSLDVKNQQSNDLMSTEEAMREFNMMMTEKVKKDLIEKKLRGKTAGSSGNLPGSSSTSFLDFISAVTLTNKNSVESSQK